MVKGAFLNTRQAARLLKVDSMTIYRMIYAKRLRAYRRRNEWRIPARAVETLKKARQIVKGSIEKPALGDNLPNREVLPKATA